MKTIDKVMQCLEWTDNELNNKDSDNYDKLLVPTKTTPNQITYYDAYKNKCIMNFEGELIEFNGKIYTFDELVNVLTDDDDYLLETMLNEIDLD